MSRPIVIIDDDLRRTQNMYYLLKSNFPDNEVSSFLYFEEAVLKIREKHPLIILDVMFTGDGLPEHKPGGERGIEVYSELKKISDTMPIIIYSNLRRDEYPEFINELTKNNDIFLEKLNVPLDALVERVGKLL